VQGEVDPEIGWLMDFGDLKTAVQPIIDSLDHQNLNELPGLENSTAELLAKYIWDRIQPNLPLLSAVAVWESDSAQCIYRGE
jgi:6-pyruvoyltetrahydropterin/6-carboxytetrahydropterin synthase